MPIYEYRCQTCDKVLEVLIRTGKEPEICGERCLSTELPDAGEGELVRKISQAGVIFKGSGFYVTDSKSKSSKGAGGASSSSGSTTDSGSSSTSESSGKGESPSKSDSSSKSDSAKSNGSSGSSGGSDSGGSTKSKD